MLRFALADDDPKDRETLRAYLEQYRQESGEALEVTVYTDGDELVEQYKSQFDLILLDVQMQFLDGMAAAREIRRGDRSSLSFLSPIWPSTPSRATPWTRWTTCSSP